MQSRGVWIGSDETSGCEIFWTDFLLEFFFCLIGSEETAEIEDEVGLGWAALAADEMVDWCNKEEESEEVERAEMDERLRELPDDSFREEKEVRTVLILLL